MASIAAAGVREGVDRVEAGGGEVLGEGLVGDEDGQVRALDAELQRRDVGDLREAEGQERDLLLDAELGAVDAVADDAEGRHPAALDGGVEVVGEIARHLGQVLVGGALQLVAGDADEVLADERQRRRGEERREEEELGAEREAHQPGPGRSRGPTGRIGALSAVRPHARARSRRPTCALRPCPAARARPEGGPRRPPSTPALPDREEGGAARAAWRGVGDAEPASLARVGAHGRRVAGDAAGEAGGVAGLDADGVVAGGGVAVAGGGVGGGACRRRSPR